jgi:hypothetical protein
MRAESVCARHPAAAWQRVSGEMVVLQPERERLMGLNRTGARVWELLDGTQSAGSIAQAVAAEFKTNVEAVLPEILAFLHDLESRALVVTMVL